MQTDLLLSTVRAIIFGHAIADALGVPAEFESREKLHRSPVLDYQGYGAHPVPAGTWSDDTSMTLATLDSLSHGLNYNDIMQRFCNWKVRADYTATGIVFDMGVTTHRALSAFLAGTPALECGCKQANDNGNGSLMRILPAALYAKYRQKVYPVSARMETIHNASALTHAHPRSLMGCGIYSFILWALIDHPGKASVREGLHQAQQFYYNQPAFRDELTEYARLLAQPMDDFALTPEEEIRSGGYVVSTLEAAIWCLLNTDSYADCVLKAVNLGHDTDTVAAVAGGLAGSLYRFNAIPQRWLDGLLHADMIYHLCDAFSSSLVNDGENTK